ncbi:lipoprotein [Candidatus Magnetomorum sp. HK-1]|nr:lipoprotein [Candidatus Magnetomorum sp. HK-1]
MKVRALECIIAVLFCCCICGLIKTEWVKADDKILTTGTSENALSEAIITIQIFTGMTPFLNSSSIIDINKDEKIGVAETIYILKLIAGLIEPPDSETDYLKGLPDEVCTPPTALIDTSNPDITVGNGTPDSCTESAFKEALLQVPEGGIITFSCGDEPAKITLTSQAEVTKQMTIDGNGLITLSGEGNTRILKIYDDKFSYWNRNGAYPTITLQRLIFKEGNSEGSSEGLYWTEKNYVSSGRQAFIDLFGYDGPSYHYEAAGGAVYSQFANVNIIKCLFENNKCPQWGPDLAGGGYYGFGGNTTATIVSSIFRNNTCANGGGIGALQTNLKIYNTLVEDNQAIGLGGNDGSGDTQIGNGGNGGGILSDGVDQYHHFCGVVVRKNTANSLGGGFFRTNNHDEAKQVIEKSSFDYNVVNSNQVMQLDGRTNSSGRGGMYIGGMGYLNISITDTSISHNEGDHFAGASFGEGEGHHITFDNLKINYNNARRAHGAGLFLNNPISGTISNSEFRGNTAIYDDGNPNTWTDGFAGAVSGQGAESITITNTNFIDNEGAEFFTQSCQFPFMDGGGNYQTPYDGSAGWCDGNTFNIYDKLCSTNIMCEGNILCSSLIPSDEEACSNAVRLGISVDIRK